jgi:endonuclease/exonuclease/phosphatase family metal-dependent hydrolase
MQGLRVMSLNLRGPEDPPPNDWAHRRPVLLGLIGRLRPDVIGTQEALYPRLKELERGLEALGYRWIGIGRDGGSRSEMVAILFRTDRLEPIAFDHIWLSDQPRLMGSATWGDTGNPRLATCVQFTDRESGERWTHVNTHLDHQDEYARCHQAGVLLGVVDEHLAAGPRLVVTGDFNAEAGRSATYRAMTSRLHDAWISAHGQRDRPSTFHGYSELDPADRLDAERIDWILISPDLRASSATVPTVRSVDGTYPSDHWPVVADVIPGSGARERFQITKGTNPFVERL